MRTRKQVYELTADDFRLSPVWEFALDEEGQEGQDEATVKPRPDLAEIGDPQEGDFVCPAEFRFPDGSLMQGYLYARSTSDFGSIQPVVITSAGQVAFWHGAAKPKPSEVKHAYALLGRSRDTVFPLAFRSIVPVGGKQIEGTLPAFLYLADDFTTIIEVT